MSYAWYSHQDNTVYSSIESFKVRNIFTTVSILLNSAISLIGSAYLKRSAQRILLQTRSNRKQNTVPIHHLVSWLTLGTFASYVKTVRKIPGGGLGLLMIWTGLFSLLHQYFTNTFINTVPMSYDCSFDYGVVTTHNSGGELVPASTWPAARLVYEAYLATQNNGGMMGIYDKINYNTTYFWPQKSDILGYWDCSLEAAGSSISPSDWNSTDALDNWINTQSFLYNAEDWSNDFGQYPNGSIGGFIVWEASPETDDQQQWDLRAMILYPISGDSPLETSNYQCNMVSTRSNWVPPILPAYESLTNWSSLAYGIMQGTDQDRWGHQLQNILNGMVMISGSGNHADLSLPDNYEYNQTYNCLETGTQIGLEVFVLLATLVVVLLWLVGIDLYALVLYWRNPKHAKVREIPLGHLEWQLEAVREATSNTGLALTAKDLGRFEFGWIEENNTLGIKESGSEAAGKPLLPIQNKAVVTVEES